MRHSSSTPLPFDLHHFALKWVATVETWASSTSLRVLPTSCVSLAPRASRTRVGGECQSRARSWKFAAFAVDDHELKCIAPCSVLNKGSSIVQVGQLRQGDDEITLPGRATHVTRNRASRIFLAHQPQTYAKAAKQKAHNAGVERTPEQEKVRYSPTQLPVSNILGLQSGPRETIDKGKAVVRCTTNTFFRRNCRVDKALSVPL